MFSSSEHSALHNRSQFISIVNNLLHKVHIQSVIKVLRISGIMKSLFDSFVGNRQMWGLEVDISSLITSNATKNELIICDKNQTESFLFLIASWDNLKILFSKKMKVDSIWSVMWTDVEYSGRFLLAKEERKQEKAFLSSWHSVIASLMSL